MTESQLAGSAQPEGLRLRTVLLLAFLCPVVGAFAFAAFDFLVAWSVIPARLDDVEKGLLLVHGLGRHLVVGVALGLVQVLLFCAPRRIGPLDGRVVAFTIFLSALFVFANWTIADGAGISKSSLAPLLRWGTRIGGPIAILVVLVALKRLVVVPLARRRGGAATAVASGVVAFAASAFLAHQNVTRWPGNYPGLHLQMAFGALLFAQAGVFALGRWRPLALERGARPLVVVLATAAIVAASLYVQRMDRFQPVRSSVSAFFQGTTPFQPILRPVYDAFAVRRELRVEDVESLIAAQRSAEKIDVEAVLARIPNRKDLNVLLVALDTVRWDHTSLAGYGRDTTPFLAELARSSYVFSNAYTPYPTSNYAYAALLTGLHAGATPLHLYRTYAREEWSGSPEVYYPEYYSNRGWWSLGVTTFARPERENMRFFGMLEKGFDLYNPDQQGLAGHLDAEVTTSLLNRLRDRPAKRFFAFTQYFAPHDPYESREGFDFGPGRIDRYDSEIAFVDRELRNLVDGLKKEGLWDDTILVVFSDHGEALGEHGNATHNSSLYEEEIRIPLLVRVPGLPGSTVAEPVSLIDVMPTITKILGLEDATPRLGSNVLPWMFGYPDLPARSVFAQQYSTRPPLPDLERRCVVHVGYKLIETVERPESTYELYDLAADPDETRNLFGRAEAAEIQGRLLGLLAARAAESDASIGKDASDDPVVAFRRDLEEGLEKLRSADPKTSRAGAVALRVALLNRYGDLNEIAGMIDPEFVEGLRREVHDRGMADLPRWSADVVTILSLLPSEENAPYLRALLGDQPAHVRYAAALAMSRQPAATSSSIRDELLEMTRAIPDPLRRFEGAVSLARVGEYELLDLYVPFLRSDSTWELGPLLDALTRAANPAGLDLIADRLANLEYFDFTLKRRMLEYARACEVEASLRVALQLADDADSGIKGRALALLEERLGAEAAAERLRRYDVERGALVALANGKADLAAEILDDYTTRWPDHPARVDFTHARALVHLERRAEADAALARAEASGDEEERRAARRWREHLGDVRWFYDRETLDARVVATVQPASLQRNRCFGLVVEVTNRSKTFWPGGRWNFAPVLRPRVLGADGAVLVEDERGREVVPRIVDNPLPLSGIAPGETITMLLVGHAPYGVWSDARIGVAFAQARTPHLPDDRDFALVLEGPWKGE